MTHADIIMQELRQRDRITMRELIATYGPRGYTKGGFGRAAHFLRQQGKVASGKGRHYRGVYARAGCCPCCGRAL